MGGAGADRRRLRRAPRRSRPGLRGGRLNALLDTHALLSLLAGRGLLGPRARAVALGREHRVAISAATVWEIEIKRALGKLDAPDGLVELLADHGFAALPIRAPHAVAAARLPDHHRDPFDRMLVAQAMLEGLVLVTADEDIPRYGVAILDARS